jgi:TonB family protein
MGYQALLFCPDEKLANIVSQVFSELDFSIDAVHEPFAAVKKLMSQRYDAIVVDSENEQNASLLFKSARNSGSNQSSLAIALVEGQMGVAKAYRIGANLVLTKPINVEQAKGTLRVARGLLRKNSDAAAASATSAATPAMPPRTSGAPTNSFQPPSQDAAATAPPSQPEIPEVEAALPAMVAEDKPEIVPASAAPLPIRIAEKPAVEAITTAPATVPPAQNPNRRFATAYGSAAAPAPAKEVTAAPSKINRIVESNVAESKVVETKPVETKPVETKTVEVPATPWHATDNDANEVATTAAFSSASISDAPTFAALGAEDSTESGGRKKVMIAAVVVLALAAFGYVGYETFNKPTPATRQPESTPQDSAQPALRPMSAPAQPEPPSSPSTTTPARANATSPTSALKIATAAPREKPSAGAANSPLIRIASDASANSPADSELAPKKTDSAPLLVKSTPVRKPSAIDESAPQLPSELASASTTERNLTGLMSSSAPALPKAPVTTLRVSQGVSQGLLIKRVKPIYPQAALAIHAQGAVQIEATVNKEGMVVNPKVLSGDAVLAQAALEAVRQWRYKPYYLDGEPVEIKTQITVNFKTN